jgi:hypothetical protein
LDRSKREEGKVKIIGTIICEKNHQAPGGNKEIVVAAIEFVKKSPSPQSVVEKSLRHRRIYDGHAWSSSDSCKNHRFVARFMKEPS